MTPVYTIWESAIRIIARAPQEPDVAIQVPEATGEGDRSRKRGGVGIISISIRISTIIVRIPFGDHPLALHRCRED